MSPNNFVVGGVRINLMGREAEGRVRPGSELDELCGAISMKCSQTGMLVAIRGEFVVLDRVSQPDVLDSLFGPLVQGYALDSIGVPPAPDITAA